MQFELILEGSYGRGNEEGEEYAQAVCREVDEKETRNTMKTNIDVLDNPNNNKAIQASLVRSAIWGHERKIREWKQSPKNQTRAIQRMISEYNSRLETLKKAQRELMYGTMH